MKLRKFLSAGLIVVLFSATSAGCTKEEIIAGTAATGTVLGGLGTLLGAFTSNSSPAVIVSSTPDKNISATENDNAGENLGDDVENLNSYVENKVKETQEAAKTSEPETQNATPAGEISQLENKNSKTENLVTNSNEERPNLENLKFKDTATKNDSAEKILQQVFNFDEKAVEATKDFQYKKVSGTDYCGYSFDRVQNPNSKNFFYNFEGYDNNCYANCYGKDGKNSGSIKIFMQNLKTMQEAQELILKNPFEDNNKIKDFKVTPIDKNTVIQTWLDTEHNVDVIKKIWVVGDRYDNCATQSVTFSYNVNLILDESKVVAKHIFDSFKPGFKD